MTFEEFYTETLKKRGGGKKFTVTNSYKTEEMFYYYRKNSKYKFDRGLYRKISDAINLKIAYYLTEDRSFKFPFNLGYVIIERREPKNYKKYVRHIVDWRETIKLWYEDEECRKNKVKVLKKKKPHLDISYLRDIQRFPKSKMILFNLSRSFKMRLNKMFENGNYECYG